MWPAVVYFLVHATHDRVQGNWPSFLFPAFALLAAYGANEIWTGRIARPDRFGDAHARHSRRGVDACVVYAQAFFGVVPKRDPIGRLTAFGIRPVMDVVRNTAAAQGARAIITTSYATTGWLAFYLKPKMAVVQINEDFRWLSAPQGRSRAGQGTASLCDHAGRQNDARRCGALLANPARRRNRPPPSRRADREIRSLSRLGLSRWRAGTGCDSTLF